MQWWTLTQLKSSRPGTRAAAVAKLARQGGAAAIHHLVDASNDSEIEVRKSAAEALGEIGTEEALPVLRTRIYDPEPQVRLAIVKALQKLAGPEGLSLLVFALGDPSGEVAWHAAQALAELGWQAANETEMAAWHLAVGEFDKAIVYGSAAVEPLARITRNLAFHRCIRAVESLAQVGHPQVVKPLLEALTSADATVRSAAASALGQVGMHARSIRSWKLYVMSRTRFASPHACL